MQANSNRKIIPIYLNKERDADIIEHISTIKNISNWFREQIRKEISYDIDPQLNEYILRLIDTKLALRGGEIENAVISQSKNIKAETNQEIDILSDIDSYILGGDN